MSDHEFNSRAWWFDEYGCEPTEIIDYIAALESQLAAGKARADRLQAELHEYAESYEKMKAERDRQYDENVHRRDRARDRELGYINDQLPPDR